MARQEELEEGQEEIGKRLINIREALGFSVREFAERLGLHIETYRNYERGVANIPLRVLKILRKKFYVNLHYLIAGEGSVFFTKKLIVGKSYFIGNNLRKLREMLSLSTSEFLSYLDSLSSEAELIAVENNQVEASEEVVEDICESFSVDPAWLIGKGFNPFRTKKVNFENLEWICRTQYPDYRPEILFTAECRSDSEPIYFAIFLKGNKPYQGILLYEHTDFAIWRTWFDIASKIKEALYIAYQKGMYSVRILDKDIFHELIIGRLHSVKAVEKGTLPTFPFLFALYNEKIRIYLPSLEFERGLNDYGLLKIIKTIEEKKL